LNHFKQSAHHQYFKVKITNFQVRIILCLLIGFSLLSCNKAESKYSDDQVFRYNEHANVNSLDPAFAKDLRNIWPANQLYNGLVQLDDQLNVQPDLSTDWEISEDGKTYAFTLREDVYFHKNAVFGADSTRLMQAKDVVFSLKRLQDPDVASPGSWVMRNVKNIQATGNHKVEIELEEAFPAFLGLLSMTFCSIIPEEMEDISFHENPIGTGPFKFKRWAPNEKLVFRKNELYFEKDKDGNSLPYLEAVAITFLPEKQSEFMQFALGNLDFLSGLDASYKDELLTFSGDLQPKYEDQIKVEKAPYLNMEYIGITLDFNSPEVHSEKLRQALNYGVDRKNMIRFLRNGIGFPAENGFIPKGLPGFGEEQRYTYNPKKAESLIKAYREENQGIKPKINLATTAQYLDICEFLQREWQKIGVDVEVEVMPASTLLQQRSAGKLESFRASWVADYPDAQNYLSLFYSPNFAPEGPNYTHFKNEEFDRIYEKSLLIPEPEERVLLYKKMDSIIMNNAAVVPLYYDEVVRFTRKNVNGLGINPQNLLDLRRVKKE